ncbi:hypothetical protein CHCC20441_0719 [Bacillus licheniformis]|uniref:Uncharacterized protein n=1 Tax=Bacillus licheniformis TaxID=1402 RepID=A0A8B5YHI5_BACLI|nr:hypothetical protein B4092_2791 [Bacillus licheniformis]TWN16344.1 hypothetical protein CHCC14564_0909 [Bacillus licheniformis LMG 17339]KYC75875.1 hypothetical protein B4090_2561 [Bacillus licheniformis]KYC85959.1 hypothetical protein B4091_2627 [Bacillus licheniformis]TWJ37670.1 hypothetical protein CHCC5026_2382 [Bacillus licheniformis]
MHLHLFGQQKNLPARRRISYRPCSARIIPLSQSFLDQGRLFFYKLHAFQVQFPEDTAHPKYTKNAWIVPTMTD